MGLDLYAKIEKYLDFEEEVKTLHKEFLEILSNLNPKKILDIGCGQGAFLQHLKFNGVEATGIDLSNEQIKICKEKGLDAQAVSLEKVKEKFDVATAIFDVVNYIPANELENFFKNTNEVLEDEGYFVFDVNTFFGFNDVAQGSLILDRDDKFIAIDAFFENDELKTNLFLFEKKGDNLFEKESDFILQYYHNTEVLNALLEKAGFEIEGIKDLDLHGFGDADKQIFVCKKKFN